MRSKLSRVAGALLAIQVIAMAPAALAQRAQRVFISVADSVPMPVPAATTAIADALTRHGWSVLATYDVGTDPARCAYAAEVIVANEPKHATALMAHGPMAAFAIPVRVGVFEDERGVHVSMVNPLSIERTIVAESGLEPGGQSLVDEVTSLVADATHGRRVNRPYGQSRDRGLIGKTMGIMAGGPFVGRVETITPAADATADVGRVADDIWQRLQRPARGTWQLRAIYRLNLAEQGIVILGVSGAPMESRAFGIVGAGGDDARAGFKCPGLAYAPAFPLELVVVRDTGRVGVRVIDSMFRMKMYFEDAGRMKFTRNMRMPGSIADELRAAIQGRAP